MKTTFTLYILLFGLVLSAQDYTVFRTTKMDLSKIWPLDVREAQTVDLNQYKQTFHNPSNLLNGSLSPKDAAAFRKEIMDALWSGNLKAYDPVITNTEDFFNHISKGKTGMPETFIDSALNFSIINISKNENPCTYNPFLKEEACDPIPFLDQFGNDSIMTDKDGTQWVVYIPCPISYAIPPIESVEFLEKWTFSSHKKQLEKEVIGMYLYFFGTSYTSSRTKRKNVTNPRMYIPLNENKKAPKDIAKLEVITQDNQEFSEFFSSGSGGNFRNFDYSNENLYKDDAFSNYVPNALIYSSSFNFFKERMLLKLLSDLETGKSQAFVHGNIKWDHFLGNNPIRFRKANSSQIRDAIFREDNFALLDQYGEDSVRVVIDPETGEENTEVVYAEIPLQINLILRMDIKEDWEYNLKEGYFKKTVKGILPYQNPKIDGFLENHPGKWEEYLNLAGQDPTVWISQNNWNGQFQFNQKQGQVATFMAYNPVQNFGVNNLDKREAIKAERDKLIQNKMWSESCKKNGIDFWNSIKKNKKWEEIQLVNDKEWWTFSENDFTPGNYDGFSNTNLPEETYKIEPRKVTFREGKFEGIESIFSKIIARIGFQNGKLKIELPKGEINSNWYYPDDDFTEEITNYNGPILDSNNSMNFKAGICFTCFHFPVVELSPPSMKFTKKELIGRYFLDPFQSNESRIEMRHDFYNFLMAKFNAKELVVKDSINGTVLNQIQKNDIKNMAFGVEEEGGHITCNFRIMVDVYWNASRKQAEFKAAGIQVNYIANYFEVIENLYDQMGIEEAKFKTPIRKSVFIELK